MRAVAEAAQVSIATVSRALQSPDRVAPETLDRIIREVRALGYTPNIQARNLRTSQTRLIIALVPDIANPFFSEVIRGIEMIAQQRDYAVLLGDTQLDIRREQAYADLIAARQADGLITLLPRTPKVPGHPCPPVVNACELAPGKGLTSVSVDNVAGAAAAAALLCALGHQAIAFLGGPATSPLSLDRRAGFERALRDHGLEPDPRLILEGDFTAEAGIRAVEALIARDVRFTALQCANDEMALGAMSALDRLGRRVPQDVSVVGFDDIRLARFFVPPLTTVAQPALAIGCEAATLLIDRLANPDTPIRRRVLATELVIRGSTGPAPPP